MLPSDGEVNCSYSWLSCSRCSSSCCRSSRAAASKSSSGQDCHSLCSSSLVVVACVWLFK